MPPCLQQQRLTHEEVEVDPKFHGHIVGSQGANIKAIQSETGASVNVSLVVVCPAVDPSQPVCFADAQCRQRTHHQH